jgi:hypothetical protein
MIDSYSVGERKHLALVLPSRYLEHAKIVQGPSRNIMYYPSFTTSGETKQSRAFIGGHVANREGGERKNFFGEISVYSRI